MPNEWADRDDICSKCKRIILQGEAITRREVVYHPGCTPLPPRYRPSLRLSDGLYEIFLYPDDPAWDAANKHLQRRAPYALSNGRAFIGRPEDYARFEEAIGDIWHKR